MVDVIKPRGGQIDDDNVGPQDMDAEEDNIVELEEEEHAKEERRWMIIGSIWTLEMKMSRSYFAM